MPDISVIIATYRDDARLAGCLSALDRQTFPRERFEVIVVNNDPVNEIDLALEHSLDLILVNEKTPGSYAARNTGIKHARGSILAFTDSDAIPADDWIERGVSCFEDRSGRFIVAGKMLLLFENERKLSMAECYEKYFAFPHQRIEKETLQGMVAGNVFILSRTFREIGPFNGSLTSGGDSEFSSRAIKNNYVIKYNPECIVYHPSKHSLKDLLGKKRRIFGGKIHRRVKVDGRKRIPSIASVLMQQSTRYINEFLDSMKLPVERPFSDRIKLAVTIKLIIISLMYESAAILLANRMRRR